MIFHVQFVHHPEGLQELCEVYAAVLVEVDTAGQLIDGSVVNGNPQVSAEKAPGVAKLLNGDQTLTHTHPP